MRFTPRDEATRKAWTIYATQRLQDILPRLCTGPCVAPASIRTPAKFAGGRDDWNSMPIFS